MLNPVCTVKKNRFVPSWCSPKMLPTYNYTHDSYLTNLFVGGLVATDTARFLHRPNQQKAELAFLSKFVAPNAVCPYYGIFRNGPHQSTFLIYIYIHIIRVDILPLNIKPLEPQILIHPAKRQVQGRPTTTSIVIPHPLSIPNIQGCPVKRLGSVLCCLTL